jgi:transcriptional regulator with XRE-family HTH domain
MKMFRISKTPSETSQEIAFRHKEIRKKNGWSQVELAERSGVSLGSLKRFERTGQISLESLLLLANVLNRLEDFDLVFKPGPSTDAIEKLFSDKTRKS